MQNSDATQAGFRPCLRCRPTEADAQVVLVEQICRALDHADQPIPTLAELGSRYAVSPAHLQRVFTRIVGVSPRAYAQARRAERLRTELKVGDDVTTALYDAGYGSSGRAYSEAPQRLGMTPTAYRRGGADAQIHFATTSSPLGRLLVAATERGICFVAIGDQDAFLEAALHTEIPAAQITRDDDRLAPWLEEIVAHLEGREPHLDLPIDVRATAFQEQVWQALRAIPSGSTRSYGEIAQAIGKPGAARAVGQACGTNPVALIIPCHRVIAGDKRIGGYRWGSQRKQALLEAEYERSH
jgi:AraC family transcriptional regulator of adaptative response/methylated-DNA-[protein]-cysteine methyltransferase